MGLQNWKKHQLAAFKALPQWKAPDSIEDLERDLQGISNFDEINFPLLYAYAKELNTEEYSYFINRARTWYINNSNQTAQTNVLVLQTKSLEYKITDITQPFQKNDPYFKDLQFTPYFNTDNILFTAYHEAGHALMGSLISEIIIVKELRLIKNENSFGRVSNTSSTPRILKNILTKDEKSSFLEIYENNMLIDLAGGQAYQILLGQRLSAHEFLNPEYTKYLGMGTIQDLKDTVSDMSKFKTSCEKYIRLKNNIPKSQPLDYQKDILPVAIEMYEKGYDILDAHKDRLRTLAQKALKEKILYADDIYATIDIERPPYLHEFLIPQPILELGKKTSSYLQAVYDINPQDYMLTL